MSRSTRTWFRLAVPALLVIASIVGGLGPVPGASGQVVATPATLSLGAGWNLVGASAISGTPSVASTTCSQLNTVQAGTAVELDRWIDGGWEGHRCGLPVNDFTLQSGQGYFIRLTRPATWAPVGAAPVSPSSTKP